MKKRVHLLSAVNARNVARDGSTYTIRDVCGAVDGIVMNAMLYPGDQLATAAPTLEGKPAPAGHPKNAAGQFISAVNGEALASAWIGSYARNARHEGGRTLVDVIVNAAQAQASDAGKALLARLDAAIDGTSTEPIHVSTGLLCEVVNADGESRGKKYQRIATNIQYDHLAILLNEQGAGTPADGVGMFLNAAGKPEEVETADATGAKVTEDLRGRDGLVSWLMRLMRVGNSEISFDQIRDGLYRAIGESAWVVEVYDRYAIWSDRDGNLFRQDYAVGSDGSVAFSGVAQAVRREVKYETFENRKDDPMKDTIVAALNAAGIKTEGLGDAELLAAYNALVAKPVQDKLDAANAVIANAEAAANAAEAAEVKALAAELAVNSALTAEDLEKLGKDRLIELKAKAAPVLPGAAGGTKADPYAGYSLNAHIETKQAA